MLELELTLTNQEGFSVVVFVPPTSTVADVLATLTAVRTFTDPFARFAIQGREMERSQTLASYGITDKATLLFVERARGDNRHMRIDRVRNGLDIDMLEHEFQGDLPVTIHVEGQDIVFLVQPTILVGYLKLRLEYVTGIPYSMQTLSYPNKRMVMENIGTLQEYRFEEGDTLHLASLAPSGGKRRQTRRRLSRHAASMHARRRLRI